MMFWVFLVALVPAFIVGCFIGWLLKRASRGKASPPRCVLVRAHPNRDFYVGWSYVVDDVVWVGTYREAVRDGFEKERIAFASQKGSSSRVGDGWWDSPGFIVCGFAWLRREELLNYALAALAEDRKEQAAYLEPCDDSDPEWFVDTLAKFVGETERKG